MRWRLSSLFTIFVPRRFANGMMWQNITFTIPIPMRYQDGSALDDYLAEIPIMQDWASPRLGIRFDLSTPPELQIYRPDGEIFLTFEQVSQRLETTTRELETISQTLLTTEQTLVAETDRNQQLAGKLRELGIDPDTI
jgi:hypothetical protein